MRESMSLFESDGAVTFSIAFFFGVSSSESFVFYALMEYVLTIGL